MVGIAGAATKMAGDFEYSINKLYTTAGEAKNNLGKISQGILDISKQVGYGANDMANAMYYVESANFHGARALEILKAASMGAKAENADLTDTVRALTAAMNSYGGAVSNPVTVMNTLIAATARGSMQLEDLVTGLKNVLPATSRFGISLTDAAGAMAVMTTQGDNAASAGTHLRQMILSLVAGAKPARDALHEIGTSTEEMQRMMSTKGLTTTLDYLMTLLARRFPEGSEAYNVALRNIMGGTRQLMGGLELTGPHLQTFINDIKGMNQEVAAGGKSIFGWADVQKTFNFQMDVAKAKVEATGITIGTKLLPVMAGVTTGLSPLIEGFGKWATSSGGLVDIITNVVKWLQTFFARIADNGSLKGLSLIFSEIGNTVRDVLLTALKTLGIIFGDTSNNATTLSGSAQGVADAFYSILRVVETVTSFFQTIASAFAESGAKGQILRTALALLAVTIAGVKVGQLATDVVGLVVKFEGAAVSAALMAAQYVQVGLAIVGVNISINASLGVFGLLVLAIAGVVLAVQNWDSIMAWFTGSYQTKAKILNAQHLFDGMKQDEKTVQTTKDKILANLKSMEKDKQTIRESSDPKEVAAAQAHYAKLEAENKKYHDIIVKNQKDADRKRLELQKTDAGQYVIAEQDLQIRLANISKGETRLQNLKNLRDKIVRAYLEENDPVLKAEDAKQVGKLNRMIKGEQDYLATQDTYRKADQQSMKVHHDALLKQQVTGWDNLKSGLKTAGDAYNAVALDIWNGFSADFNKWSDDEATVIDAKIAQMWSNSTKITGQSFSDMGKSVHDGWNAIDKWTNDAGIFVSDTITQMWNNSVKVTGDSFSTLGKNVHDGLEGIKRGWATAWDTITQRLTTAWDTMNGNVRNALSTFGASIATGMRDAMNNMGAILGSLGKAAMNNLIGALQGGIGALEGFINFFVSGFNTVAGWFNTKGPPPVHLGRPAYLARGTDSFEGGAAVVGEEGRELIFLPRGAKVATNKETEALLSKHSDVGAIPHFAGGTGITDVLGNIIDLITGRVGDIVEKLMGGIFDNPPALTGIMGNLGGGILNKFVGWAADWVKNMIPKLFTAHQGTLPAIQQGNFLLPPNLGFPGYAGHHGIDFQFPQNSPVYELVGGMVSPHTGWEPWGGEVDVLINGIAGMMERYLHLEQILVGGGQMVSRGQLVGLSGGGTPESGYPGWSNGPHLHVQYDWGDYGNFVNPLSVWGALGLFDPFMLGGGGGRSPGRPYQKGGTIPEKIFGIGAQTGKNYLFGEKSTPEAVTPAFVQEKMATLLERIDKALSQDPRISDWQIQRALGQLLVNGVR